MTKELIKTTICDACGSENVERLQWVRVNTSELSVHSDDNNSDLQWCCDCEKHVSFKTSEELEEIK